MGIEVRVHCEFPKCEETAVAIAHTDDRATGIVDELADHRFHFTIDTDWVDGPEGWTISKDGQILCPTHRLVEVSGD